MKKKKKTKNAKFNTSRTSIFNTILKTKLIKKVATAVAAKKHYCLLREHFVFGVVFAVNM